MRKILGGLALLFASICFGIYKGSMEWVRIKTVDIPSENVNLKILLIADLHANSATKMNLNIWNKLKDHEFDMAVITGDVIIGMIEELQPHIEELRALAQKVPVFFVEGNHEIVYRDEIRELCARLGITTLYNEKINWKIGENRLCIIGLRDYYMLRAGKFKELAKAIGDLDESRFNLVLSHQPQIFDRLKNVGFDLMLSGHTHGGQLRLPFLPTLYAPAQGMFPKYGDGLYEENGKFLYVSRGIGTTIFPVRFFNRPEVTIINIFAGEYRL